MMLRMSLLRGANCLDFTQYALLKMTELMDKQEEFRVEFNRARETGGLDSENKHIAALASMADALNTQNDSNVEIRESVGKRAQSLYNHRRIFDAEGDVGEQGGPLHDLLNVSLKYSSDYDYKHYSAKRDGSESPDASGDHE